MQFRTFDELTPEMDLDRTLVNLASFGSAISRRVVEGWRRTNTLADYVGLFTVERGRVIGQTFVLRIPYTFPGGTELVTGLAAVGTRPDRGRSGVARALLTEIHRREKEAGIRFSTLWTNRSWGAHRLYESLGYKDIYSAPWAVHAPLPKPPARPAGVRAGRRSDLVDVEQFHARRTSGRLGFTQRGKGFLTFAVDIRDVDPGDLVVVRSGGRLRGYAYLELTPFRAVCGELMADSGAVLRTLITETRRRARGRPFAFQHTPVTDHPELFQGGGYTRVSGGWYVFMAAQNGASWSSAAAVREFAIRDPRFLCQSGDRF